MPYRGGGYMRKGVLYAGPTKMRGRPKGTTKRAPLVIVPAKPAPVLSKTVKSAVKRIVKSQIEVKYAPSLIIADTVSVNGSGLNYDGVTNLTGWCSGPGLGTGLLPQIGQGASEGARVGNKIKPKSFNVRISLNAKATTDASTPSGNTNPFRGIPFIARVIIFKHRYADDDYSQTGILNNGNASELIGNTVDDLFKPYNRDEYRIYYSKDILMAGAVHNNTSGINPNPMENKACSFWIKNVRVPLPQTLHFNDGVTAATNAGMFLAVCVINTDGSVVSNSQSRVTVNAEANLSFYDA